MSSNNNNLDVTDIDTEDHEQLAIRLEGFYKQDSSAKNALTFQWQKNHLFLDGKQWIIFDGARETGGVWKELKVSRANEYIPRPVTNYLIDVYQTLKAYLVQQSPRSSIRPNTNASKDKMAAKVGELALESNWEKLKEEYNYEMAAAAIVTYGTVFKKDYWDTSTTMIAKVPKMEQRPVTDPQTGQVISTEEVEAIDPMTGDILYEYLPLGDVNTAVIEPYRMALDPLATDLHNSRWIMEYSIQPLNWIKETYGKEGPGYTGKAEEIKEEKNLSNSMQRFWNLRTSSGVKSLGQGSMGGGVSQGSDEPVENAAVLKEYYERPCQKYPKGRLIVVANGITVYAGESPYEGPELGDWHPYSEARWEIVPGRFWGKSPLDEATEIQKNINSIDSTIILTRKTMAIPQKLIPVGAGIRPGEWTGRPGQELRYRPSDGVKPETIPPVGVDAQVFQERTMRIEDLKAITGAIDILKGDRPPGVTAASALELLYEVGTGKLRPVLNRWKRFIEGSQKKQLKLISKFYKEPRKDFIRLMMMRNTDIPENEINNFIGTDLYDNCNVTIEAGSNIPKLHSAEKANLLQLAQTGALQLENPENRIEFLDRMGVRGFDIDVGPDVKRAEWENDLLDDLMMSPDNHPVTLAEENHATHKEIHMRRVKEPSFMSLPSQIQQAYMRHIQEHQQYIEQQQLQAQMQAMQTGQPPQPPAPAASQMHQQPHPAGKGVSKDTQESLNPLPRLGAE